MIEVIKNIAAIVGCVLSCISLLTIIVKPMRKTVINWIAEVADKPETVNAINELRSQMNTMQLKMEQNAEERRQQITNLKDQIDSIIQFDMKNHKALKDMIRERIVSMYYANLEHKTLHFEEWETVSQLNSSYESLNGNTFVKGLIKQMSTWDIIQ